MKKKIFIGIALLILFCPFQRALAVERNFGAGSLIIPMDNNWQTNTVGFHGQTIPGPGVTVVITYPVEGTC